jgi:hypothetical protein
VILLRNTNKSVQANALTSELHGHSEAILDDRVPEIKMMALLERVPSSCHGATILSALLCLAVGTAWLNLNLFVKDTFV